MQQQGAAEQQDAYGFPLEGLSAQQRAERAACAAYEARRRAKWQVYVDAQELPSGAKLKRYCRKGVPHDLRGWVWWHVSGAGRAAAAQPGHYEACLQAGSSKAAVRQIELDLPRTFPRHAWLAGSEGQQALRSVLTAYAGHNPDVGYCQGMNFLVGLLLVAVERDCTRCFWLLVVLLEQVLYPGTYAPNLDGCHVEMGCLGALLDAKQPALAAHLAACGAEPSLLTTDWYLCLFATSLPPESAARVWDALLLEGRKVLHRVGLALLGMVGPQLMHLDNPGEMLRCLKSFASGLHQRDQLMAAAFKGIGGLPRAKVERLQAAEARKVSAMLSAREATRRRTTLKDSIAAGQALRQQQQPPAAAVVEGAQPSSQEQQQQQQVTAAVANGSSSHQQERQQQQQQQSGQERVAGAGVGPSENGGSIEQQQQQQQQGQGQGMQAQAWAAAGQVAVGAAAAAASVRSSANRAYASFKGPQAAAGAV